MHCTEFDAYLEQVSGEPFPPAAAAHLDACERCRNLLADFQAIQSSAAALGSELPEPPEHIWLSVRSQLLAEGLIHEPAAEPVGLFAQLIGWVPRPALAGAYLTILLVAAVLLGVRGNLGTPDFGPVAAAGPEMTVVRETLRAAEVETASVVPALHPDVSSTLRKDMALVDNVIAMCEKKVREEPRNTLAREYLLGAYQQKAD
ncbi:MAG: hypothetical protein L0387_45835, partial [Acidobacteria bacterium]|nr:hypothetical protein [Acidobacteriota bacterium]